MIGYFGVAVGFLAKKNIKAAVSGWKHPLKFLGSFGLQTTQLFLGRPRDILMAVSKFGMVFDIGNPSWAARSHL